ncbi:MAG: arginine deiminase-related protein [bacterium]|nr:arginine deiminase-related protein [bacterium]
MKEKLPQKEQEGKQTTDTVLMIYPDTYKFNPETATSNTFMKEVRNMTDEEINKQAKVEFGSAVIKLTNNGINVIVIHSVGGKDTPDAVYPNNWISFNEGGMILYPMRNNSRSIERQPQTILQAFKKANFETPEVIDLSYHEQAREIDEFENSVCTEALEGTGSMVLDRVNKISYAIESPRTTKKVFDEWCNIMDYEGVFFHGENEKGPIYHTNVIMGIGEKFAVISLESIKDINERATVLASLQKSGKEVIDISLRQVDKFCGNLLELKSTDAKPKIVMSTQAYEAFTPKQIERFETFGEVITLEIPMIENGGGSARCILAEVFFK